MQYQNSESSIISCIALAFAWSSLLVPSLAIMVSLCLSQAAHRVFSTVRSHWREKIVCCPTIRLIWCAQQRIMMCARSNCCILHGSPPSSEHAAMIETAYFSSIHLMSSTTSARGAEPVFRFAETSWVHIRYGYACQQFWLVPIIQSVQIYCC